MQKQLVPANILVRADKILFITHLAIGDFLYWQTYFKEFHSKYPQIKIHIWVDEIRRTRKWWKWKSLQKYSLYDWLKACPFIDKVYDKTYSPAALKKSIIAARLEGYPVIVSLCYFRTHRYARLVRSIAPGAFIAGLSKKTRWFNLLQNIAYRNFDAQCFVESRLLPVDYHITDLYAYWFEQLFGITTAPEHRKPFVNIPRDWRTNAKLSLLKWGVTSASNGIAHRPRIVFINIFAKDKKRCWSIEAAFDVIAQLRMQDYFAHAYFILNTLPGEMNPMQQALRQHGDGKIILFSAREHFFQLPAIIELCDLVISVETAVMHLAAALEVPVIALMRTKKPEWVPWDEKFSHILMAAKRTDWVKNIPTAQVINAVSAFVRVVECKMQP
ncbi:glycosyltransferase family 9 protein [Candidatus Dependentiae bacterium]|nr:glycosyltransferase family 9 protein [Candidatus Dependentiae bacterium]